MIIGLVIGFVLFSTIAGWAAFNYLKKNKDLAEPETGYYIGAPALDKQFQQELQIPNQNGTQITLDAPDALDQTCAKGEGFSIAQNKCVDFQTTGQTNAQEIRSDNFVTMNGRNVAIVTEFEWVDKKTPDRKTTYNKSSKPICVRLGMLVPLWTEDGNIQRPKSATGDSPLTKTDWESAKEKHAKVVITENVSDASFYWEIASQQAVFFKVTEWNSDCVLTLLDTENIGEYYFKYLARFVTKQLAYQPFVEAKMWIPKSMKHPYARKTPYELSGTCPGGFDGDGPFWQCKDDDGNEQPIGTECGGYMCVPALTKCDDTPCTSNIHGKMCLSEHVTDFIEGFEDYEDTLARRPNGNAADALKDPFFDNWGPPESFDIGDRIHEYDMLCYEEPDFLRRTNNGKRINPAANMGAYMHADMDCIASMKAKKNDNVRRRKEFAVYNGYGNAFYTKPRTDAAGKATKEMWNHTYPDTAKICHCPPHEDGRIRMCTGLENGDLFLADDPKVTELLSDKPGGPYEGWWLHLCNSYYGVDGVCRNDRDLSADGEIDTSSEDWWCKAGAWTRSSRNAECQDLVHDYSQRWSIHNFSR